jgi:hypothetical protein
MFEKKNLCCAVVLIVFATIMGLVIGLPVEMYCLSTGLASIVLLATADWGVLWDRVVVVLHIARVSRIYRQQLVAAGMICGLGLGVGSTFGLGWATVGLIAGWYASATVVEIWSTWIWMRAYRVR